MDFQSCLKKHAKNIKEFKQCLKKSNQGGGLQDFFDDISDDQETIRELQNLMAEIAADADFQE